RSRSFPDGCPHESPAQIWQWHGRPSLGPGDRVRPGREGSSDGFPASPPSLTPYLFSEQSPVCLLPGIANHWHLATARSGPFRTSPTAESLSGGEESDRRVVRGADEHGPVEEGVVGLAAGLREQDARVAGGQVQAVRTAGFGLHAGRVLG